MHTSKPLQTLLTFLFLAMNFIGQAQEKLTTTQWQDDLRYLQETVHTDYPFLFKKISKEDFDQEVEKLYKEIPTLESQEIPVAFSRIVSLFKYGHTQIRYATLAQRVLPINIYAFTDGIYVEGGHKNYATIIGGKLLSIEGVAIDDVLRMIRPVVPVENDSYFKAYGLRFALVPNVLQAQGITTTLKNDITVTVEKEGKILTETITAVPLEEIAIDYGFTTPNNEWIGTRDQRVTPLHLKYLTEKLYYFEYLEDSKTVYARQSRVRNETDEDLKTFYARLFNFIETHEVDRLIYDVRYNGGGNNFLNTPLITGVVATKKINKKGNFFVVTGRQTFSAAQNLVNRLAMYTNAVFVGESTAENVNFYGDAREVVLPNSQITAYLSAAWWQDNAPWDRATALHPDIPVSTSFEQYITNDDPVIDAIIHLDRTKTILDPIDHITALLVDKQFDKLEKTVDNWLRYGTYSATNFKGELNTLGNILADRGALENAFYILELNTRLFADAPETWSSLAQLMIKKKDIQTAKLYLEKAIQLDPAGKVGLKAKAALHALH